MRRDAAARGLWSFVITRSKFLVSCLFEKSVCCAGFPQPARLLSFLDWGYLLRGFSIALFLSASVR